MSVSAKHSKTPRRLSRWVKLMIWTLSLGLLLVVGLYLGLQTRWTKDKITAILNDRLGQGSVQIQFEGLSGTLPHRPRLGRLRISDANGCWLEARDIVLNWRPQRWLQRMVDVRNLEAEKVFIYRRPQSSSPSQPKSTPTPLSLPYIRIHRLNCDALDLHAGVINDSSIQVALTGSAQVMGRRSLVRADLQLSGDIQAKLSTDLHRSSTTASPYQAECILTFNEQTYQLTTGCDMNRQTLTLNDLQVELPFMQVAGDLSLDRQRKRPNGALTLDIQDLSVPAAWIKRDIQGHGLLEVTFPADHETALGHWQVEDLVAFNTQVERSEGDFVWSWDSLKIPTLLQAQAQGLTFSKYHCEQVELTLDNDSPQMSLALTAQGQIDRPFALETQITLPKQRTDQAAQIDRLSLQWGEYQGQLQCPAVLWQEDSELRVNDWQWQGDPYRLSVNGVIGQDRVDLLALLKELPLEQLPWTAQRNLRGTLGGRLQVNGSLSKPCIAAQAQIQEFNVDDPNHDPVTPLNAAFTADLSQGQLQAQINLATDTQDRVDVLLRVPTDLSLYPWALDMQQSSQEFIVQVDTDVRLLDWVPVLRETQLRGRLQGSLEHEGSWADSDFTGELHWREGTYEDSLLGSIIRDIEMTCQVQDDRNILLKAKGQAGLAGRIEGQGQLCIDLNRDLPYQLEVTAEQFPWIQRQEVSIVASGKATLTGTIKTMQIEGDMQLNQGHLDLNALPPSPPPVLVESTETVIGPNQDINTPSRFLLTGAIQLDLGNAFQISGWGIESFWGGQIGLRQQDERWKILGELTSVHGEYRLLSRTFRLDESTIRLDGRSPIDPILDVTAMHRRSGIEAVFEFKGRASNPILNITSDPAMPEDAVLAAVLFGKDLSTISSWQALQLANTLRLLRSPDQNFGLFERTREMAGVDYLNIESQDDDNQDVSVAVGKYVRSDVYVEFQRPLNSQGVTTTRVEYEVQPNLTVEADVGAGIQPGLQINWKKDY